MSSVQQRYSQHVAWHQRGGEFGSWCQIQYLPRPVWEAQSQLCMVFFFFFFLKRKLIPLIWEYNKSESNYLKGQLGKMRPQRTHHWLTVWPYQSSSLKHLALWGVFSLIENQFDNNERTVASYRLFLSRSTDISTTVPVTSTLLKEKKPLHTVHTQV